MKTQRRDVRVRQTIRAETRTRNIDFIENRREIGMIRLGHLPIYAATARPIVSIQAR